MGTRKGEKEEKRKRKEGKERRGQDRVLGMRSIQLIQLLVFLHYILLMIHIVPLKDNYTLKEYKIRS